MRKYATLAQYPVRIPVLAEADLNRVIQRDFADQSGAMVVMMSAGNGLSLRAKVAAVKSSGGSIEMLSVNLEQDHMDERDVIAGAEYARYLSTSPGARWLARTRAITGDWREYSAWLAA